MYLLDALGTVEVVKLITTLGFEGRGEVRDDNNDTVIKGGNYTKVGSTNIGGEVHHMPAKSVLSEDITTIEGRQFG